MSEDQLQAVMACIRAVAKKGRSAVPDVKPGTHLFDECVLDSFAILELVAELEKSFGIEIATEDLIVQNFATPASVAELVTNCQASQA